MRNNKIILPFVVTILVILTFFLSRSNQREILNDGVISTVKILDVMEKRKGITTSEKVAIIVYDTDVGRIEHRVPFQPQMEVGKCYELVYSKENVKNVIIDDSKEKECPKE